MYGKFAHKYLILQAAIYLINIFFIAYWGLKWVIAAALPYIVIQVVIDLLIRHELRQKADECLKENYPILWERYTGKSSPFYKQFGFSIRDTISPQSAAEYLLWDTGLEFEYKTDQNIKDMRTDIKMRYISLLVGFLPLFLAIAAVLLCIAYMLIEYIGRQMHF